MENNINLDKLNEITSRIRNNPGITKFQVNTKWAGQTKSISKINSYNFLGKEYERNFVIESDEPNELLGENTAPNPQELLMAALNACLTVGYVANASIRNIKIFDFEIETKGYLDLRGFLGIDESINPGYNEIQYIVRISSNGTREQIEEIHQIVAKTSPNYANFSKPIHMIGELEIVNKS